MSEKISFDWEEAKGHHSPAMHEFLLANYQKLLTEDEFVKLWVAVPRVNKTGGSVVRNPSKGRQQYKRLKERFGFFSGNQA